MNVKALSIKQPFASLICAGAPVLKPVDNGDGSQRLELAGMTFKDVENRSWRVGRNPRHGEYSSRDVHNFTVGLPCRIYVHASKQRMKYDDALITYLADRGVSLYWSLMLQGTSVAPVGAIIGEVDIIGCVKDSKSIWADEGYYHFQLANPIFYKKPIPYKGQLGFFEVNLSQPKQPSQDHDSAEHGSQR